MNNRWAEFKGQVSIISKFAGAVHEHGTFYSNASAHDKHLSSAISASKIPLRLAILTSCILGKSRDMLLVHKAFVH